MDDEMLMRHFETYHPGDLAMEFRPEPDRVDRRLNNPKEWRTYHETLHRLWPERYGHDHNEEAAVPSTEKIYVVTQTGQGTLGAVMSDAATSNLVAEKGSPTKPFHVEEVTLHRPDLRPIYGGPTLLEALWDEMDALMERLMTGQQAEDGGDKFRAQELAWVLAIVTDPYQPSVDKIRAETMDRWNAAQAAAEAQAEEQQHKFDAAGVNGYEL